ncbi:MAG: ABC transporter ATP-binding protein [Deltaproteobacteria bacterium]|nr:ABC transporter ATP-binding protein [Deltaproteobacteria bacterium]MBW2153756.1 ABC transporter ATP-binding protein [Deltaproteobacteria bacterium]
MTRVETNNKKTASGTFEKIRENSDADLLKVKDLRTFFYTEAGLVKAVDGIDFSIPKGSTVGIVGESGCGKSVTSLSIMRLLPSPPAKIGSGEIILEGLNLLTKTEAEMRAIRGNSISMIFQEPMTSLNPVLSIGKQITEAILLHTKTNKRRARQQAIDALRMVGIPSPERRVDEYPHQMSGGMRQRAMIAMALSCRPRLLIADEPTTALDVTIQAQILVLMERLRRELGMAVMLITHDLAVVAEVVSRVYVMYAGKIVETADTKTIFKNPHHPYTRGLIGSIPRLDEDKDRLQIIKGTIPNPVDMPPGCRFHPRCDYATDRCRTHEPHMRKLQCGHEVRCWL